MAKFFHHRSLPCGEGTGFNMLASLAYKPKVEGKIVYAGNL